MAETSIIIRAYNEEKHLPALFERLTEQDYNDFETIVVDSGSIDRTREIAHKRATRLVHIRQHDFTFGYSLNEGIRNSSGRFIAIISAHALPAGAGWLRHLVDPLRDSRTAMVYGRQEGVKESKFGEYLDFTRTFGIQQTKLSPPNFFANNANSAIRRDLWEIRSFDETLPGLEDADWAKHWMEQHYMVVYEPSASVYHIHNESWPQVRRRYYREGQAAKWIGVTGRRDVPGEVVREIRYFFGDVVTAAARGDLLQKTSEIVRFRCEKAIGRVSGIWDGARMQNPKFREQILFDKSYDACVIHSPKHASVQKLELPELKPGEILVRVAYEGVCATDLEMFEGSLGYYKSGLAKYPIVPGHEFSGTVAAVGARVTEFEENDRVVVECIQGCGECDACHSDNPIGCVARTEVGVIGRNGGYAEYMITPSRFAHKIPDSVSLREASLCEPLAVVLKGLRRLKNTASDAILKCAVVGAGPIGHLAALLLASRGHEVVVFDRNAERLKYFEHSRIRGELDVTQKIGGFAVVIEATGHQDALETVLHKSQAASTLLLLGLPYARRDFNFESIVGYDKTVVGSVGSTAGDFVAALDILPQLRTAPFLEQTFKLCEVQAAWDAARSGKHLKVMLEINGAGS